MGFKCPECGSYMFGTSCENGILTYHCHGNEEWSCNYTCSREFFKNNFEEKYNKLIDVEQILTLDQAIGIMKIFVENCAQSGIQEIAWERILKYIEQKG